MLKRDTQLKIKYKHMKRILVPTDFTEQSENALSFAYQIAKKINGEIELLHVLDPPEDDPYAGMNNVSLSGELSTGEGIDSIYFVKLLEKSNERLEEISNRPEYSDVTIFYKMQTGTPYKNISKETERGKVDLIIMGTSGVSNWEEAFVGSNAERVVRNSKCPVFSIQNEVNIDNIKNIAYASDFKFNHEHLVDFVKEIGKLLKAKIHLVKVNTPSDFKNDKTNYGILKSFAEENKFSDYELHVYNHEEEEDGIICFAESFGIDMIVMATEGRTGFSRLLEGSIAEDVVNFSKIPVLTFRTTPA
jgi:nucleotide-binding universal stress UspA family protein